MIKKKILIITGEFIPYTQSIGGVIRIISFLKILKGNDLKLITLKKKNYGYFGFKNYLKHVKISFLKNNLRNNNSKFKKLIIFLFKILFSNLLYILGLDQNYFNRKLYFKAVRKNLIDFKPDFILISGPPFSLFKIVEDIRIIDKKVKIILDYRDGWTQRIKSKKYNIIRIIMNKIEKNILEKSNFVLCATEQIFKDILIMKKKNVFLVKNGYLNNLNKLNKSNKLNKKNKNNKKISIGYFGLISDNIFGYRNINIIYNALKLNNNLYFSFFGNSIIKNNQIKNYKYFNFHKNISYFETQNKMKKFDYLLILHTEKSTAKEVMTGKFYEYLSSQIPIIMISDGETEAGKLIKRYKLGHTVDYSKISLENFFFNLKKMEPIKINKSFIKQFSRLEQNKKLFQIVNSN